MCPTFPTPCSECVEAFKQWTHQFTSELVDEQNERNEWRKEGRKEGSQERTKDWMNQSNNHAIFRNHPRFLLPKNPLFKMLLPLATKAMWRRIRPPGNGPKSSCKWSAPSGFEEKKAPCIFWSQKQEKTTRKKHLMSFLLLLAAKTPGWFSKNGLQSFYELYIHRYVYVYIICF